MVCRGFLAPERKILPVPQGRRPVRDSMIDGISAGWSSGQFPGSRCTLTPAPPGNPLGQSSDRAVLRGPARPVLIEEQVECGVRNPPNRGLHGGNDVVLKIGTTTHKKRQDAKHHHHRKPMAAPSSSVRVRHLCSPLGGPAENGPNRPYSRRVPLATGVPRTKVRTSVGTRGGYASPACDLPLVFGPPPAEAKHRCALYSVR